MTSSRSSFGGDGSALALAVALGDLAGELSLEQVTGLLSDFADRGDPSRGRGRDRERVPDAEVQGFAVIAMGKLGSRELNYSSDVDLLLLFDPATLPQTRTRRRRRSRGPDRPSADRAAAEADRRRLCRAGRSAAPSVARSHADRAAAQCRDLALRIVALCRGSARRSSAPRACAGDLALGQRFLERDRAVRVAPVARFRGDRRSPADLGADPRPFRARRAIRPGLRPQARPRRHPRSRILRADPANDPRRARSVGACAGDARCNCCFGRRRTARRGDRRPSLPKPTGC